MQRNPSVKTIKYLYARSGNLCAFPGCTTRLVNAQSQAQIGEFCHICAASPGGPRFDPTQSVIARNAADNLILLCPNHHSLIDQSPSNYTADAIANMKRQHESRVAALLTSAASELTNVQAINFSRQIAAESVDFAIVVALRKELDALRRYFPDLVHVPPSLSSTRSYYRGEVQTKLGAKYRIVVTLLHSMGNLEAAHATSDLIRDWNPRYMLVNGIAGGISRSKLDFGDIAASSSIVYYEPAKIGVNHLERRSTHFEADPTLLDGILNLATSAWRRRLPARPDESIADEFQPRIHIGPIASGEKVIATIAAVEDLQSMHGNLIAVEMESAGVASAAFSAIRRVGFLAIRSVCDFADERKSDNWQDYAAHSAASCLRDFLESHPVPPSEGTWPTLVEHIETPILQISTVQRRRLFDRLCSAFDMEEFKNLCFLLGVDTDELPGDRKSSRVRELILLFERRRTLTALEDAVNDYSNDGST